MALEQIFHTHVDDLPPSERVELYYGLGNAELKVGDKAQLIKVRDDDCTVLAETRRRWSLEKPVALALEVRGHAITGIVDGAVTLRAEDNVAPFENGGIGLVIVEGALSTDQVHVEPLPEAAAPAANEPVFGQSAAAR